jgi:hypothetical protein
MKGPAMKLALMLCAMLILTGVVMAWTGRRILAEEHAIRQACAPVAIPPGLEARIPYDIRITSDPPPWCDPIDLVVELDPVIEGTERWIVMDGDTPQMTFGSFDDLYYRCDGPDCFRITVKQRNESKTLYVSLK